MAVEDHGRMAPGSVMDNMSSWLSRCWHAVATSDEVGTSPTRVLLLGEPWVLYRPTASAPVVAFEDRCPHRLAPLSAGRCRDGVLECGYHGWRFAEDGRCVLVPALGGDAVVPSRADLRPAAGVRERAGLVWLAPDPPVEDLVDLPEWDADASGFDRIMTTVVRTPVSAGQLVDNFLDAAHFPFVHTGTFGDDRAAEVNDDGVERDGWSVRTVFDTWYRNHDDPLVATGEHDLLQPQRLLKRGGASLTVYLRLSFPVTGATLAILFSCQPESPTSTRIFKVVARDDTGGDPARIARCIEDEDRIMAEDLALLERYDRMVLHLDPRVEVHTRADRLSLAWRRVMADLRDAAPDLSSQVVELSAPRS
jgi:vanillate O-demethylase monooxygenase subunit